MQFSFLTFLHIATVASAHMMVDHPSVWGRKTQGGSLETPLNKKTGSNWLHHGASKDTSSVMTLTPGKSPKLNIVCGEANGKANKAASICKTKSDVHKGGGCALSIAYTNTRNPTKDDFIIISVNHNCPSLGPFSHSFPIPSNLPACNKCTCAWHWVPDPKSSAAESYMNTFNCKVAGKMNEGKKIEGKVPLYFGVKGGNGKESGGKRPMYKNSFPAGAQKVTVV